VKLTIQSAPISLGSFLVDGSGGVTGGVTIPPGVEDGYHTLHLTGVNREGTQIDLYQFVTIGRDQDALLLGPEGDSTTKSTPNIRLSEVLPSSIIATNASEVLGAQADSTSNESIKGAIFDTVRHIEGVVKTNKGVAAAVIGLGVLILLTISAFLVKRRWVKPGS
jgi:hypothetical protein